MKTHIPSKHTPKLDGSSLNEENMELSDMENASNREKVF